MIPRKDREEALANGQQQGRADGRGVQAAEDPAATADPPAAARPLATTPEVMRRLGVSRNTLWRLGIAGEIPGRIVVGRRAVRWDMEILERWIAEGGAAGLSGNRGERK